MNIFEIQNIDVAYNRHCKILELCKIIIDVYSVLTSDLVLILLYD